MSTTRATRFCFTVLINGRYYSGYKIRSTTDDELKCFRRTNTSAECKEDPIQTMSGSEIDTSGVLIRRVTAVERFQFSDLALEVFVEFLKVVVRKQHS